jgi:hypothetical protein
LSLARCDAECAPEPTFVTYKDLTCKLAELERKYDVQFKFVFDAIRQLLALPEKGWRPICFRMDEVSSRYGLRRPAGTRGVRRPGKR